MNKTLRNISSLVPNTPNYQNIRQTLDFTNCQKIVSSKSFNKMVLIVLIPALILVLTTTIGVPLIINSRKIQNKRLIELNDNNILSYLLGAPYGDPVPIQTPSLDQTWEDYKTFKEEETNNYSFFYELNISFADTFLCYYLPKTTIQKMDSMYKENPLNYLSDEKGNIDYLRYFGILRSENKLDKKDKVMVCNIDITNHSIEKEIEKCELVNVSRDIYANNDAFGDRFIETVEYSDNGTTISFETDKNSFKYLANKYDHQKVMLGHAPYIKKLFQHKIIPASFLDIFSLVIDDNGIYKTGINYDHYYLDSDPDYYNDLDSIIIERTFVLTQSYEDYLNNEHIRDYYYVTCDYVKTKLLFDIK